jgi:heme oxygenase
MAASEPANLAERLRTSTAAAHREAERSPLMRRLLGRPPDHAGHARLLQQLLPIYSTLETLVAERADDPWLAAVWAPALARTAALQADLGAHALAPRLPATEHYVARLQDLQNLDRGAAKRTIGTARLLAHVYVRHLGDLSGGQTLQRLLGAAHGTQSAPGPLTGLSFYRFGDAAEVVRLKAHMRGGLSLLPAEGEAADAAVDEAIWAFDHHLRLFDEVATAGGIS